MRTVGIVPLTSFSNTLQSSNRDGRNTNVVIQGSDLENGKDYLIFYNASYGSRSKGHKIGARLDYGSTVIGRAFDKGVKHKNKQPQPVSHLSGFYKLTGDGSSDLRIKFSRTKGTSFIFSAGLIALPLENLILDADYFISQQNGDNAEISTTSNYQTLVENTFRLPEKGDYLVLMSAEGFITRRGKNTDGEGFRFIIDGAQYKPDAGRRWKLNGASRCCSYARMHSLPAGLRNFRIDVGPIQGKNAKSFRRGRIIVIRADALDQSLSAMDDTPQIGTSNYSEYFSQNYAPNQQEYILAISNSWTQHSLTNTPVSKRIRNITDGVDLNNNSDSSESSTVDKSMLTSFACEQITSAKNYQVQIQGEGGSPSWQYGDFVVLSLTGTPIDTVIMPDSDGSTQGVWTIVGGASTHADTLDMADGDTTYVRLDSATVGDFLDVKLDNVSGAVDSQITDEVILEFRARTLSDEKECELNVQIYEGDPAGPGTLVDGYKYTLSETQFEEIRQTFTWSAIRTAITDFNNLHIRISVSDITGSGSAPDVAVSLVRVSLPGKTSKNIRMLRAVPAIAGQKYTIYTSDGLRRRKITFDGEGWLDRDGVQLENQNIHVVAYEVDDD